MKRYFRYIALLMAASLAGVCAASAQQADIYIDKLYEAEGYRMVAATPQYERNGAFDSGPIVALGVSVQTYTDGKTPPTLCLHIIYSASTGFAIPKGGTILLQLSDDTVIELHNLLETEQTIDRTGTYHAAYGMTQHQNQAKTAITPEQIRDISEKGIIKIRTELENAHFDLKYRKPKFRNILQQQYDLIEAALATRTGDIREGF